MGLQRWSFQNSKWNVRYHDYTSQLPDMSTVHPIDSRRFPAADGAAELLGAYLATADAENAESLLGELISRHIEPMVFRIVSHRLRRHSTAHHSHAEDVASEAVVSFLLYVEDLGKGRTKPVGNLVGFAATLAARSCNDYFRRAYPAFHGLRNKLRYLLERYPNLARWKDPGTGIWICGLAAWQVPGKTGHAAVADLDRIDGLHAALSGDHPADQLARVFVRINAPIPFNDLALLMARLWNVQETTMDVEEDLEIGDTARPADVTMAQKQWMATLWERINELSGNQRAALLLNLRGPYGGCGASLLVSTGVATIRQIAHAAGIPDTEFAELWGRLPLSDLEVASLLAITRQQVINLRKCARAKLTRQMQPLSRCEW